MNTIAIWAGRPSGVDPTVHFWFKHSDTGLLHRICDGAISVREQKVDKEQVPFVPCGRCKETYLVDLLYGRKLLTPSFECPIPVESGYTPVENDLRPVDNGQTNAQYSGYHQGTGGAMPDERRVSVFDFAQFCEATPERQESVVIKIRKRSLDNKGFDYYGPLKNLMRKTHWATNDLTRFESALPSLLNDQRKATIARNYQYMAEAYISYWKERAVAYFPVDVRDPKINLEGLNIWVNPEMGMRTRDDDHQILKLWFNRLNPTRQTRLVIGYLVGKINSNAQWHSGIWDIKRRNIPLPVLPPDGFDLVLAWPSCSVYANLGWIGRGSPPKDREGMIDMVDWNTHGYPLLV